MTLSLRVIVVLLVAIVGVAATLIALLPVRAAGLDAVRSTSALLRDEIGTRLSSDVLSFFTGPMEALYSLREQHDVGLINGSNCRDQTGAYGGPMYPSLAIISRRLNTPVYAASPSDLFCLTKDAGTFLWDSPAKGSPHTRWIVNSTTWELEQNILNGSASPFSPQGRPWYAPATQGQNWGSVYINSGASGSLVQTVMTAGTPLINKQTQTLEGVVAIDAPNDNLVNFFKTISIAKTGRAILLDAREEAVLGGTWNESAVVYDDALGDYKLASVSDMKQDALFSRTLAALGAATLFNASLPFSGDFDKGLDLVYVDILRISDQYGLDLRLVIMIPEKDFLESVVSRVNTSIGAVCGAVVALLIVAIIITQVILDPLAKLETRMYCAASFQDLNEEDEASGSAGSSSSTCISEVANIQIAFTRMSGELKRIKSYLPRSLLAALENEDEELEESERDSQARMSAAGSAAVSQANKSGAAYSQGRSSASRRMTRNNPERDSEQSSSRRTTTMSESDNNTFNNSRARGASIAQSFGAAKVVRGLFVQETLVQKKISVMVINLRNSHLSLMKKDDITTSSSASPPAWSSLQKNQSALLEVVQVLAKKHKGVIDTFHGDHVTVLFNAVFPTASHEGKAGTMAVELISQFQDGFPTTSADDDEGDVPSPTEHKNDAPLQPPTATPQGDSLVAEQIVKKNEPACPLTIGISSGECVVGNMGIDGLKRFHTVGAAFNSAMILERLCKTFAVNVLTDASSSKGMHFEVQVEAVGAVTLPRVPLNHRSSSIAATKVAPVNDELDPISPKPTKNSVLFTLTAHRQAAADEWMYELQEQEEKNSILNTLNKAWKKFVEGDVVSCKELVDKGVKIASEKIQSDVSSSSTAAHTMKKISDTPQMLEKQREAAELLLNRLKELQSVASHDNANIDQYLASVMSQYYSTSYLL